MGRVVITVDCWLGTFDAGCSSLEGDAGNLYTTLDSTRGASILVFDMSRCIGLGWSRCDEALPVGRDVKGSPVWVSKLELGSRKHHLS